MPSSHQEQGRLVPLAREMHPEVHGHGGSDQSVGRRSNRSGQNSWKVARPGDSDQGRGYWKNSRIEVAPPPRGMPRRGSASGYHGAGGDGGGGGTARSDEMQVPASREAWGEGGGRVGGGGGGFQSRGGGLPRVGRAGGGSGAAGREVWGGEGGNFYDSRAERRLTDRVRSASPNIGLAPQPHELGVVASAADHQFSTTLPTGGLDAVVPPRRPSSSLGIPRRSSIDSVSDAGSDFLSACQDYVREYNRLGRVALAVSAQLPPRLDSALESRRSRTPSTCPSFVPYAASFIIPLMIQFSHIHGFFPFSFTVMHTTMTFGPSHPLAFRRKRCCKSDDTSRGR